MILHLFYRLSLKRICAIFIARKKRGVTSMPSYRYGTTEIEYNLIHDPDRYDISIVVEWLDGVSVIVPEDITSEKIDEVLHQKAPWILKKWREINEIKSPTIEREFVSGEKLPYLGRQYRLKVVKEKTDQPTLNFHQGRFYAHVPITWNDEERIHSLKMEAREWYIKHGNLKLNERLRVYLPKMNVEPQKVAVKDQKMRWGSCTSSGSIYLNWRLFMAPMRIADYVLVHELAHLRYPNHSKDFWKFVRTILQDYDERKEWLRINGPTLDL